MGTWIFQAFIQIIANESNGFYWKMEKLKYHKIFNDLIDALSQITTHWLLNAPKL